MTEVEDDPDPEHVVEECSECGSDFLEVYLRDGVCPECRGE